jgi:hypothetical protein
MPPFCESYAPADRVAADGGVLSAAAKVCETCLLAQLEKFG